MLREHFADALESVGWPDGAGLFLSGRQTADTSRATGISCRADCTDARSLHSHKAEVIRVHTQSTEAIVAPKAWPFCKSADITTTSKAMNVDELAKPKRP